MAIKNQSITITYSAWDTANNVGKTGDSANHTLRLVQDGTEATPANSPSEVDATNLPGVYKITLTAGEMNYSTVTLGGKSSTTGIVIIPVHIVTEQGNFATVTAKTNNLPASPAATGDKMDIVDAPSATGKNALADAFLTRDFSLVSYTGTVKCILTSLQKLRNTVQAVTGKLKIYKENGTDLSWEQNITEDSDANPVTKLES